MKRNLIRTGALMVLTGFIVALFFTSCKKEDNPIKFPNGSFPDTGLTALTEINSQYDDYNANCYLLQDNVALIFSSNRGTSGGKFDLIQSSVNFTWNQSTGLFSYDAAISNNTFLTALLSKANTAGNDFGPYTMFSPVDGYEYLLLASENNSGDLDLYFLKNMPFFSGSLPTITGPLPATLLNTSGNDAYISFNTRHDTAYYSSDSNGDFDIYLQKRPSEMDIATWLSGSYSPGTPVDSLNSTGNDKCPFCFYKILVFTSDRPGGFGGYDIYYSLFKNGKWGSPINMGPGINTQYNEYRPLIGTFSDYTNLLMIFSSDRPGGKGMFDLYFTGTTIE